MQSLRVFIGYDPAEAEAYRVCEASLRRRASIPVEVIPLQADRLAASGLLRRVTDARGGELYDLHSNAPQATEFAISRFLVPLLAQTGPALFVDCDMVFLGDVAELLDLVDDRHAVRVVKHQHRPANAEKMCGKTQTAYPFKNWSSVVLWNCDHPANRRLSLYDVQSRPGRDLHAFYWLADPEIGELPPGWNWLVNEQPAPEALRLAHFTNGGPWFPNWQGAPYDDIWQREADAA